MFIYGNISEVKIEKKNKTFKQLKNNYEENNNNLLRGLKLNVPL